MAGQNWNSKRTGVRIHLLKTKESKRTKQMQSIRHRQSFQIKSDSVLVVPNEKQVHLFRDQNGSMVHVKKMPRIENLVLSGGGVRGLIDIGAIKALEDHGLMSGISKIAGTSIGAVLGAAVAFGMKSNELEELMSHLNFKDLLGAKTRGIIKRDGLPLFHFIDEFIKMAIGNYFSKNQDFGKARACKFILDKLNKETEITFQDLDFLQKIDPSVFKKLHVKAYCIEKKMSVTFDSSSTPCLGIATACRASSSLPVELKHTKIEASLLKNLFQLDDSKQTYSFVDGGMYDNIPADVFEQEADKIDGESDQNLKTLSFLFDDSKDPSERSFFDTVHVNSKKIMHMGKLKRAITNTAIRLDGVQLEEKYTKAKKEGLDNIRMRYPLLSVPFKTHGIKSNDYEKAKTQFSHLINQGYVTVADHINNYFGTDFDAYYHKKFDNLESFFLSISDEEMSSLINDLDPYKKVFSSEEFEKIQNLHFRQFLCYFKDLIANEMNRYFYSYQTEDQIQNAEHIKRFLYGFFHRLNAFEPSIESSSKKNILNFIFKKFQQKIFKCDPGDGSKLILFLLNQRIYDSYHHIEKSLPHGILKIVRCIQSVWNEKDPEKNKDALERIVHIARKAIGRSEVLPLYQDLLRYDLKDAYTALHIFT